MKLPWKRQAPQVTDGSATRADRRESIRLVVPCTGTTVKGRPCTLEPETGTDRCIFHPREAS